MSWLHPLLHDPSLRDTYEEVRGLAGWSDWAPFLDATAVAPREPGVYLLRDAASGITVTPGWRGPGGAAAAPAGGAEPVRCTVGAPQ